MPTFKHGEGVLNVKNCVGDSINFCHNNYDEFAMFSVSDDIDMRKSKKFREA